MVQSRSAKVEPLQTFHWEGHDRPSEAVILAIAEELEEDPLAMEPLHNVVDPDALDSFFSPARSLPDRAIGKIQFEYDGLSVVVEADGSGYIYQRGNNSTSS